jgi:hypothetical protein
MRTTLTIEPALAQLIRQRMKDQRQTMKQVVNDALRVGLRGCAPKRNRKPFRVEPFSSGFAPGIDPSRLNQLLDEMDVEEYLAKQTR